MENRIEKNEKKVYETPVAEKIEFQYDEQIANGGSSCNLVFMHTGNAEQLECKKDELFEAMN